MKVLFVTLYALETNTSVTKSNMGLLSGLLANGVDVTIVMPEINNKLSYYDQAYDLRHFEIIRIPSGGLGSTIAEMNSSNSMWKRKFVDIARVLYNKFSIFDRTKEYIDKAAQIPVYDLYYDYIISTSDPKTSHLFASELIKNGLKYGKWIQHWGDPLVGDISSDRIYPNWYLKRIEHNILKVADRIIYVSPFTSTIQKKNHVKLSQKIDFVPLACDDKEKSASNLVKNNCAVYLGDYSSHIRNIMPLYNAVKRMPELELIIAGNTDLTLQSCDNIKIIPRVGQEKVRELENNAKIIVSVCNLKGTQIPGKLYYSSSTSKRILVTIDGDYKDEISEYIKSYNRFDVCENTEESIINSLKMIINSPNTKIVTPERLLPRNVAIAVLGGNN